MFCKERNEKEQCFVVQQFEGFKQNSEHPAKNEIYASVAPNSMNHGQAGHALTDQSRNIEHTYSISVLLSKITNMASRRLSCHWTYLDEAYTQC